MDAYFRSLLRNYAATSDPDIAIRIAKAALRSNNSPFPDYLAIGIHYEAAFSFSRCVLDPDDPVGISYYLSEEAKTDVPFDEILVITNDESCPGVIRHYNVINDYP